MLEVIAVDEIREIYNLDSSLPEVVEILKLTKTAKYKKGEIILRPYDDTKYMYRIRRGLIKIYRISSNGNETIVEIYGPGDIFPIGWIINHPLQDVYWQALTDCELRLAPKEIILKYLKTSADFSFAILCKAIEQFALFSSRVNNLELKFGRERLAYILLLFAARFGKKQGNNMIMPFISQQDLAGAVNMSREGVSQQMSRFERLGLVQYTRSKIIIKSPEGLRDQVGKDVAIMFFDQNKK